jgi:hypothetical protein
MSLLSVDANYVALPDEVLFDHVPTQTELTIAFKGYAAQAANEAINLQIQQIEEKITDRRKREALPDESGGNMSGRAWMFEQNNQIEALRAKLP